MGKVTQLELSDPLTESSIPTLFTPYYKRLDNAECLESLQLQSLEIQSKVAAVWAQYKYRQALSSWRQYILTLNLRQSQLPYSSGQADPQIYGSI